MPSKDDLRINRRIRIPEVRLVGEDGSQLGVFITSQALKRAEEAGLDLVEVSPMARPPVCKIMDYGKYKYELSKKKHDQKKKQVVVHVKEIKMRPSTDEHDFQTKLKHIRQFLEDGNRVKVTIRFRGRELAHIDIGRDRLKQLVEGVKDLGEPESFPKMEGRQLTMILVHGKKKEKESEKSKANKEEKKTRKGPIVEVERIK